VEKRSTPKKSVTIESTTTGNKYSVKEDRKSPKIDYINQRDVHTSESNHGDRHGFEIDEQRKPLFDETEEEVKMEGDMRFLD
jgi:hypothetical protein